MNGKKSWPLLTAVQLSVGLMLFTALLPRVSLSADIAGSAVAQSCEACQQFDRLNTLIRDRKIAKAEARKEVRALLPVIREYAVHHGAGEYPRGRWVFPVEGLTMKSAGDNRGADYVPSGYDYFDGNAHRGHPAYDLFIHDRRHDSLDDRTGREVSVLSMTGGIVVAVEREWDTRSRLRGGKYIWIYDISSEALVYYAHNREILVGVGDIVKPGDTIAKVGRTGYNAYKKRSPTHLHLSFLRVKDGYPKPENIYRELMRAATVPANGSP